MIKAQPLKLSLEITNALENHYKTQEDKVYDLAEESEQESKNCLIHFLEIESIIKVKNKPVLSSQRYFDSKISKSKQK